METRRLKRLIRMYTFYKDIFLALRKIKTRKQSTDSYCNNIFPLALRSSMNLFELQSTLYDTPLLLK